MPRSAPTIVLILLAAACDNATDPASVASLDVPAFATGGGLVDPEALTPPPSATGAAAECREDGRWIICHTFAVTEFVNAPLEELSCGTVYATDTDARYGIRWYNASDSVLVKRHVRQDDRGFLTLSPDGRGPTVRVNQQANWYDSQYADPQDTDSGIREVHGQVTVSAPGFGVIAHIAGHDEPDGIHHGLIRWLDDPAVSAELCAALAP